MSSVRPQDRASLCLFRFSDGRRCLTPRSSRHPQFCFFHARKEAQASAADDLGNDLSFVFSGEYVSACDLSTALARIIPDVARGHVKPKTASTIAYLAQTLVQTMHLSQNEYIRAFGDGNWEHNVEHGIKENYRHLQPLAAARKYPLAPPAPLPNPPATAASVSGESTPSPDAASTHPANQHPDQNDETNELFDRNDNDENSPETSDGSPDFPEDSSIPHPNPASKPN
jgi:hypothetical protein